MGRPVFFPNVESNLKRMIPGYSSLWSYSLADGVTVDQLNSDERYLLGIF